MCEDEVHVWRGQLDPAASRRALRGILGHYLDEDPAATKLRAGEHGKPALADPAAPLRFNLSHSGGLALIALSRRHEVGVDVERIRPRRNLLALADRALDPAAAAAVRAAPPGEQLAAFHSAWTRREAVAKCHGTGLKAPLPSARVAVSELDAGPGFAAALAVAADAMPPVKLFALAAGPAGSASYRHLAPNPR